MKKGLIFDFDGVIIDSREIQKEALLGSYKMIVGDDNPPSIEEFFSHSGSSLKQIFTDMNLPLEMIIPYQEISIKNAHKIKMHKHMKGLLSKLKAEGYKCALCTGKDRSRTLDLLNKLGLMEIFDTVVCSDDVEKPKPHPDSIYLIKKQLGESVEHFIMIGDALNDIKCAENANVDSIAVTWGEFSKEEFEKNEIKIWVDTPIQLYHAIHNICDEGREKKKYLVNDLVVREDVCNMKCKYCLTQTSTFGEENKAKNSSSGLKYTDGSSLKQNLDEMSDLITTEYDMGILKISGGEILVVNNILDFIKRESKQYKAVQLLTNGMLLTNKLVDELKRIDNLCIQLSLDHHTLDGNSYRTKSEKVLQQILDNIDYVVKCKIPLEINCVLTDRNTGIFKEFADYLHRYKGSNLMVAPFPVRGLKREEYLPKADQLEGIWYIIKNYEMYKEIMAPKAYLEHLVKFVVEGKRDFKCWITACTFGSFDTGIVTPCPNYWFQSAGNLLKDDVFSTLENIKENKTQRVLLNSKHILSTCQLCFTPWDIFNLFIEDQISIDELCKSPMYSFSDIRAHILSIKEDISSRFKKGER